MSLSSETNFFHMAPVSSCHQTGPDSFSQEALIHLPWVRHSGLDQLIVNRKSTQDKNMAAPKGITGLKKEEWFSRTPVRVLSCLSRVQLFETPWTVAHQASPSIRFSRQEYWSGLPFPSPGGLPDPGIEPRSPTDTLLYEPPGKPNNAGVGSLSPVQGIFLTQG